jgi:hypothetical protein
MKSIVFMLITLLVCGVLVSALPHPTCDQKLVIEIQSANENPDPQLLRESCLIIKNRLNDYGLHDFDISVNANRNIIEITLSDNVEKNEILPLLISNGKIEFYETYNRADVIKLLEKEDELFSMLNVDPENSFVNNPEAVLGYCKPELKSQVDAYITQHYVSKPDESINFFWSKSPNSYGDYSLYLLKHNPVLIRDQILESSVSNMDDSNELMITFNENGAVAWQNLSKNNINKPIAMVIDNNVYFAPVLKNEIREGKCSVTGNFTLNEVTQLKSLINNGELPLDFKIVE